MVTFRVYYDRVTHTSSPLERVIGATAGAEYVWIFDVGDIPYDFCHPRPRSPTSPEKEKTMQQAFFEAVDPPDVGPSGCGGIGVSPGLESIAIIRGHEYPGPLVPPRYFFTS